MTHAFETFYEGELDAIRRLAAEFARGRPKIAERLELDREEGRSEDPHVERLIEAFAFLAARTRLKIEDDFPELVQSLLDLLYPHYLAPVPSSTIVRFEPDPEQGLPTNGCDVPRGTRLYSREIEGVRCRFRTAYPVRLWPIEIERIEYFLPPFGEDVRLSETGRDPAAVLRIVLRTRGGTKFSRLRIDRLRFFVGGGGGGDRTAHQLHELLLDGVLHVVAGPPGRKEPAVVLEPDSVQPVGFGPDEGLLPYGPQSLPGYRLLTEYFAFPAKFLFVDVAGLESACAAADGDRLDLTFALDRADRTLESRLDDHAVRLGCAPAVNLFEQRADPIRVTQTRTEYRVVPDVRQARHMEVYSVTGVESLDARTGRTVEYRPFFSFRHGDDAERRQAYWYARRRPSLQVGDEGTDVDLVLVDLEFDPRAPAAEELFVETLCTNRDLPGELSASGGAAWGFQTEGKLPLKRIEPVVMPTHPLRLPFREGLWRLISHLSLNHLSITDGPTGADALREMLKLYDYARSPVSAQHVSGIVGVSTRRKTARTIDGLHSAFCRGLEITLVLDPERFAGPGPYLFASVLDRFLATHASLNSFTQLVVRLADEPEPLGTWPIRIGDRTLI